MEMKPDVQYRWQAYILTDFLNNAICYLLKTRQLLCVKGICTLITSN